MSAAEPSNATAAAAAVSLGGVVRRLLCRIDNHRQTIL